MSHRLKAFAISNFMLKELLQTGNEIAATKVVSGLPKDAVICRIVPSDNLDSYILVVHSKDYEEIPEGGIIPFGDLVFETLPKCMLEAGR